jgi:hypothetical protein
MVWCLLVIKYRFDSLMDSTFVFKRISLSEIFEIGLRVYLNEVRIHKHNTDVHVWKFGFVRGEEWITKQFVLILCMGETINSYRILVGKPEGWKPLGRPRLI